MATARCLAGFFAFSLMALPAAVTAQSGPDEPRAQRASTPPPDRRPDFLFGPPKGAIALRGQWVFARAGSDLFDFVTRHLTLDKQDFNAPGVAIEGAFALTSRADAQVGVEFSRLSRGSEYRDFVDNNLLPIEQNTSLRTTHIYGSIRLALAPKGYDVSRLVWIPRRVVPYVGAGGGVAHYTFRQWGDFVDFQDLSVFSDSFRSEGWSPTAHVFGGVDFQLYRGLYAAVQGRYTKAAGTLSSDFIDFDPIDLSGFRMSAGINLLF